MTATLTQLSSIDKHVTDLCLLEQVFSRKDLRNVLLTFSVIFFIPFQKKGTFHFYLLFYLSSHPSCSSQLQLKASVVTVKCCKTLFSSLLPNLNYTVIMLHNCIHNCTALQTCLWCFLFSKVSCISTWTDKLFLTPPSLPQTPAITVTDSSISSTYLLCPSCPNINQGLYLVCAARKQNITRQF